MYIHTTRNTHAQSMPCAEEYPEICKQIFVVTMCSVQVLGARDKVQRQSDRLKSFKTKHLSYLSPLDSPCIHHFFLNLSDSFFLALLSFDAYPFFSFSLSSMITLGLLLDAQFQLLHNLFHTLITFCLDIYKLQHIVLHCTHCMSFSCRNLKQASQKMCHSILCDDIIPLLARSIIV